MKSLFKKILTILLTGEARALLARENPYIIAVTGTVGKTSAKDAIAAALAPRAPVRKSDKSYNSDLGVPLAILGERNQWGSVRGWWGVLTCGLLKITRHQVLDKKKFLVLEVGTDRPGDIRAIARWLRPHVVVVTRLSRAPVHVENFASVGNLIAEKGALVSAVRTGGTLVLNGDDADVSAYRALAPQGTRVISYGFSEAVDVRASAHAAALSSFPFRTQKYAVLAGLAVLTACGFDAADASASLSHALSAPGRMHVLEGIRGSQIIDDSYNSSPVAVDEALRALADMPVHGRRIAVLGDMLELGTLSAAEHRKMVAHAVQSADLVLLVGERASATGVMSEKIRPFSDAYAAGTALTAELSAGDVVLIKGSQGMRMERTVAQVIQDPSRASALLVRQEPEWKAKK